MTTDMTRERAGRDDVEIPYWSLESSSDPISQLRLLLAVCGDDTRAMIETHQCRPLLAALDAAIARAEAAERVVEAALRDQRANRAHVALCNHLDVYESSPEMIAAEDEMIASAVDLDIALDAYTATTHRARDERGEGE